MLLFRKKIEPTFLNETDYMEGTLNELRALEPFLNKAGKEILKRDIELIKYGIIGEKNIEFELKNSHLPIYVLRNLYYEDEDLNAQIDFLIFTPKIMIVLEAKNLFGNITVNNSGDFIREMTFGKNTIKEGLYSPITQNTRHLKLLKKIVISNSNTIQKIFVNKEFENYTYSLVVMANPKTILKTNYAPKAVRNKIIRSDALTETIRKLHNQNRTEPLSKRRHLAWASSYMDRSQEKENTFLSKYEKYKINKAENENISENVRVSLAKTVNEAPSNNDRNADLKNRLKEYRLNKSREMKYPAYYIFNDKQLDEIIGLNPSSVEALTNANILNDIQLKLYASEIFDIIKNF